MGWCMHMNVYMPARARRLVHACTAVAPRTQRALETRALRTPTHARCATHAPSATGLYPSHLPHTRVRRRRSAKASASAQRRLGRPVSRRSSRPRRLRWRRAARRLAIVAVGPLAPAIGARSRPRHPERVLWHAPSDRPCSLPPHAAAKPPGMRAPTETVRQMPPVPSPSS